MTVKDTIKQARYFTKEQKQQIGYYYLLSALKEDNEQDNDLLKLFDIKINFNTLEIENKKNKEIDQLLKNTDVLNNNKKPLDNFMKSKGILKDIDISDITEEELYLQGD